MSDMKSGRPGNRVRLEDVADLAGVSMKTVSNVVHDYPHVSATLRERVQAAIDELGYRPNLTARRLATGRTGMIALAIPEVDQPYFAELARHIGEQATRARLPHALRADRERHRGRAGRASGTARRASSTA